jgi:hypothetical protein
MRKTGPQSRVDDTHRLTMHNPKAQKQGLAFSYLTGMARGQGTEPLDRFITETRQTQPQLEYGTCQPYSPPLTPRKK